MSGTISGPSNKRNSNVLIPEKPPLSHNEQVVPKKSVGVDSFSPMDTVERM